MMDFAIPPQNIDAEQGVLASCLLDKDALLVTDILSPTDFYRSAHKKIFAAISWLVSKGEPVDLVTLATQLKEDKKLEEIGGAAYLSHLLDTIPQSSNVENHARLIREAKAKRELLQRAINIQKDVMDDNPLEEVMDRAQAAILNLDSGILKDETVKIGDVIEGEIDHLEIIQHSDGRITGVPTGLKYFDFQTSGFQPGDLIIIAGRPAMGKTALAITMGANAAKRGYPSLTFELEMSKRQLFSRVCAAEARVNAQKFRTGGFKPQEWVKITDAAGNISEWPMYLNDQFDQTPGSIMRTTRKYRRKGDIDIVFIDYLQLMRGDKGLNRDQEIGTITRGLKRMAKELDIPVVLLSQLNRDLEKRSDKRPMLSDLRESGNIEQDADVVVFVYRDDHYNKNSKNPGTAELIIAKQRSGPTCTVPVRWLPHFTKFETLEERWNR
jgi:replicative DNA helicase